MSDPTWDGVTTSEAFQEAEAALRHKLADAAKAYDWPQVLDILSERAELVNSARPDSESRYSVLHQAAHGGAPEEVVERLLSYGAWRTLRTLQGERAVEIAQRKGHAHLIPQLTPVLAREVVPGLNDIQHHFHLLIRQRISALSLR
jgi:hypothetical protein